MGQRNRQEEPELQRPEEAIKDLEPEQEEGEDVRGGAVDAFMYKSTDVLLNNSVTTSQQKIV